MRCLAIFVMLIIAAVGGRAPASSASAQQPAGQSLQVSLQLESSLADAVDLCQDEPFENEKQAGDLAGRIGTALGLSKPVISYEPDFDAECVTLLGFTLTVPGAQAHERVIRLDASRLIDEARSLGYAPLYIELCYPLLPAEVTVETGTQPNGEVGYCTWRGKAWDEPSQLVAVVSFRATTQTLLRGAVGSAGVLILVTLLSLLAGAHLGKGKRWLWFRRRAWARIVVVLLIQIGFAAAWLFAAYGLGLIHSLHLMAGWSKVGEILFGGAGATWAALVALLGAVRIGRRTAHAFPLPPPPQGIDFSPPLQARALALIGAAMGMLPLVLAGTVPSATGIVAAIAFAVAGAIALPMVAEDLIARTNPGTRLDPQRASELTAALRAMGLQIDSMVVTTRPPFDGPIPSPLVVAGRNLILWDRLQELPGREIAAAMALRPPLMRTWFIPVACAGVGLFRHAIDGTLGPVVWPAHAVAGAVAAALLIRQRLAIGRYHHALETTGRRPDAIRGCLLLDYVAIRLAAAATPRKERWGRRMEGVEPGSVVRRRWFRRRWMVPTLEWEHAIHHAQDLATELGYPESTIDAMLRDVVPRADVLVGDVLPRIPFLDNPGAERLDGDEQET